GGWDAATSDLAEAAEKSRAHPPAANGSAGAAMRASWQQVADDCSVLMHWMDAEWWLVRARGLAYAAVEQWDRAAADFARAAEIRPEDGEAWTALARARFALSQWEPAVAAASRAIALSSGGSRLASPAVAGRSPWYLRAVAEDHLHRYEVAVGDYSHVIELGGDGPAMRIARGDAYRELQDWQRALADYSVAIEQTQRREWQAWYDRAVTY